MTRRFFIWINIQRSRSGLLQAIIRSILICGRLGPNIGHAGCYGLLLKHLKSEELHWLHPDLTVGEVEQRYESHHVEAEWRFTFITRTFRVPFDLFETSVQNFIGSKELWVSFFYFSRRYDLRIRYVPVNFLKKFQDDRSTLVFFYQQVTIFSVFFLFFTLV